jgi:hypothetical protein
MSNLPAFDILQGMAEKKLSERLKGFCSICLVKGYDEKIEAIIHEIDQAKFREELRYDDSEIMERMRKPGFLCVMVYLNSKPIAFEYGYDISDGVYFSDSQATLIEGKGVGTTQFSLEILYLYQHGYREIQLTTEELDDQGRALRSFWERMGFTNLGEDKDGNVDMKLILTPELAQYQYERYIKTR